MRRADRLFQIIQILRRSHRPVTAAAFADELEVSVRTVYRDIADLTGRRVPIQGEAGLGYVLASDFDMPPLMLTAEEIEALVLGAQWVSRLHDPQLAAAARDGIAKIAAGLPAALQSSIAEPAIVTKPPETPGMPGLTLRSLRQAIRQHRKLHLNYRDGNEDVTDRTVWPVVIGYDETHPLLIAWCEMREAFRHFRIDRILAMEVSDQSYGPRRSDLLRRWQRWREAERGKTA